MQSWAATQGMVLQEKENHENHTEKVFRKNKKIKGVYQL